MNTPCPFDLGKIVSDCELQDVEPVQAVAWQRTRSKKSDGDSLVHAIILCKHRSVYLLVCVVQISQEWRIDQNVTEDTEFIDACNARPDLARELDSICKLQFEDFLRYQPVIVAYSGFPSEQDLAEFMQFAGWTTSPSGSEIVWEGSQAVEKEQFALGHDGVRAHPGIW